MVEIIGHNMMNFKLDIDGLNSVYYFLLTFQKTQTLQFVSGTSDNLEF